MSERIAVSVIVPAYNSAATIGRTLEALAAQEVDVPYEVIVVDDGSDDQTVAIAERGGAIVVEQRHQGPGPARNAGVARSRGEALAFTDSDCFPATDWLNRGLQALEAAGLVQGRVIGDPAARRGPFDRTVWVLSETGLYETANLFLRRELFDSLGGFEDWLPARIGKPLAEDVWLGWRARRSGATTAFADDVLVHHAVFPRRPREYLFERLRLVYFPALVRRIPEIRETYCYHRFFLSRRSAEFDLAGAGAAAAIAVGLTTAVALAAVPLIATIPYLRTLVGRAKPWGRRAALIAPVDFAVDMVGFLALLAGSMRRRTLVL